MSLVSTIVFFTSMIVGKKVFADHDDEKSQPF